MLAWEEWQAAGSWQEESRVDLDDLGISRRLLQREQCRLRVLTVENFTCFLHNYSLGHTKMPRPTGAKSGGGGGGGGSGGGGFVGFGAFSTLSVSSPYLEGTPSTLVPSHEPFPTSLDAELSLVLSKSSKKDETTKLKGLTELAQLIGTREKPLLARLLAAWHEPFLALTLHNSRRVRVGALGVTEALCAAGLRKTFLPYLPALLPALLLLEGDLEREVRGAAGACLERLFTAAPAPGGSPAAPGAPAPSRRAEVVESLSAECIRGLAHYALVPGPELCDMRCTTPEEAEETVARVRPSALAALRALLLSSTAEPSDSIVAAFIDSLGSSSGSGLWKLAGAAHPPPVRAAAFLLVAAICERAPQLGYRREGREGGDSSSSSNSSSKVASSPPLPSQGLLAVALHAALAETSWQGLGPAMSALHALFKAFPACWGYAAGAGDPPSHLKTLKAAAAAAGPGWGVWDGRDFPQCVDASKTFFPPLLAILRHSAHGAGEAFYGHLLPLLASLPPRLTLPALPRLLAECLSGMGRRAGGKGADAPLSPAGQGALIKAFCDVCAFALATTSTAAGCAGVDGASGGAYAPFASLLAALPLFACGVGVQDAVTVLQRLEGHCEGQHTAHALQALEGARGLVEDLDFGAEGIFGGQLSSPKQLSPLCAEAWVAALGLLSSTAAAHSSAHRSTGEALEAQVHAVALVGVAAALAACGAAVGSGAGGRAGEVRGEEEGSGRLQQWQWLGARSTVRALASYSQGVRGGAGGAVPEAAAAGGPYDAAGSSFQDVALRGFFSAVLRSASSSAPAAGGHQMEEEEEEEEEVGGVLYSLRLAETVCLAVRASQRPLRRYLDSPSLESLASLHRRAWRASASSSRTALGMLDSLHRVLVPLLTEGAASGAPSSVASNEVDVFGALVSRGMAGEEGEQQQQQQQQWEQREGGAAGEGYCSRLFSCHAPAVLSALRACRSAGWSLHLHSASNVACQLQLQCMTSALQAASGRGGQGGARRSSSGISGSGNSPAAGEAQAEAAEASAAVRFAQQELVDFLLSQGCACTQVLFSVLQGCSGLLCMQPPPPPTPHLLTLLQCLRKLLASTQQRGLFVLPPPPLSTTPAAAPPPLQAAAAA